MAITIKKKNPAAPVAAPAEPPKPAPAYQGHTPPTGKARECKGCGHVYMRPCDGVESCPNMEFVRKYGKRSRASD